MNYTIDDFDRDEAFLDQIGDADKDKVEDTVRGFFDQLDETDLIDIEKFYVGLLIMLQMTTEFSLSDNAVIQEFLRVYDATKKQFINQLEDAQDQESREYLEQLSVRSTSGNPAAC